VVILTQIKIGGYIAKEQVNIDSFPDCAIFNESEIMCFEHTKIDASKASKRKGSIYQRYLGNVDDLAEIFGDDFPKSFHSFLDDKKIEFSIHNLQWQLIEALKKKTTKIPKYKKALKEHIASGINPTFVREDLGKPISFWLFVEDISPVNFFEGLFSDERILSFLEEHKELSGIVYLYHPYITVAPQDVNEVTLMLNDSLALKELRMLNN
jgi:hypothetical protein